MASIRTLCSVAIALFISFGTATLARAQAGGNPGGNPGSGEESADTGDLGRLPGQTALESRVGVTVGDVCQKLGEGSGWNAATTDLLDRCSELVANGSKNSGRKVSGGLGLSTPELNDAMVSLAHDEYALAGVDSISIVSATFGVLENRLVALREGRSNGVQLAGLPHEDPSGKPWRNVDVAGALRENSAAGSPLDDRIGIFANVIGNWGNFDGTSEEAAFDFDQYGVVAGADYRLTEQLSGGVAFSYSNTNSDFHGAGASGSGLDRDAYTGSIYGTWDTGGFYVDGIFSYTSIGYELSRKIQYATINRTAKGDTHADEFAGALDAGYNFHSGSFTFGPYLRTEYIHVGIDGFTESGASGLDLKYRDNKINSWTTDLGISGSYAWSTSWGVISPYVRAEWEHEFENDSRHINVRFKNDPSRFNFFVRTNDPDRDYVNLGTGVTVAFPRGFSAFLDFDTIVGLRDVNRYLVTLGGRLQF